MTLGQAAQWLLLLATMLGLASMHTTGHSTAPHSRAALASMAGGAVHTGVHRTGAGPADAAVLTVTAANATTHNTTTAAPEAAAPNAATHNPTPADAAAADRGWAACTAGDCHGHHRHGTSDRHHHGTSVCLAVLTGLAFVLLGVLLGRRRRASHRRDRSSAAIAPRTPAIPVIGMTLISATVLRI